MSFTKSPKLTASAIAACAAAIVFLTIIQWTATPAAPSQEPVVRGEPEAALGATSSAGAVVPEAVVPVPLRQEAPVATAPVAAAPVLTLQGFLERKFSAAGVPRYESVMGALVSVRDVERSYNTKGKELTPEQRAQLDALVQASVAERKQVYERMESLRATAIQRSIHAGRFVAVDSAFASMQDSDAVRAKAAKAGVDRAMDAARERVGLPDSDWLYARGTYSTCHDGISRTVVIWYTRYDEPEFFAADQENLVTRRRHDRQYAEFFASLP